MGGLGHRGYICEKAESRDVEPEGQNMDDTVGEEMSYFLWPDVVDGRQQEAVENWEVHKEWNFSRAMTIRPRGLLLRITNLFVR